MFHTSIIKLDIMNRTQKCIVGTITTCGAISGAIGFGLLANFIFPAVLGGGLFGALVCGAGGIVCSQHESCAQYQIHHHTSASPYAVNNPAHDADSVMIGAQDDAEAV